MRETASSAEDAAAPGGGARARSGADVERIAKHQKFGPSVFPPQPDGMWQAAFNGERTYPTSTGGDAHRRGIYTFWRRTVPYPSMAAFDAPSREVCTLRRIQTSTPLQAFVMLNDPVYVECAQGLARRIFAEGGATPESRAAYALRLCLARPPAAAQVADLVDLYQDELSRYQSDRAAAEKLASEPLGKLPPGLDPADAAAWDGGCQRRSESRWSLKQKAEMVDEAIQILSEKDSSAAIEFLSAGTDVAVSARAFE